MAYTMTDADKSVMSPLKKKAASMLAATTGVNNPAVMNKPTTNNTQLSSEFYKPVTYSQQTSPNIGGNGVNTGIKTTPLEGTFMDPKATPITPQGMGNVTSVPVKSDADMYKDKLAAAAEIEANRRRLAASNLYDSTMSNLDAENAGIEPMFNDTIETINKAGFNNTESMKELMNANGWGLGDSGIAVGEVDKIGIETRQSKEKTARQRDAALADIARRRSMAASLRDNSIDDSKAWQAAQMMGVEAEAFLKAKEMAKADEKTKYEKQIADSQLGIQKDDLQLRKDKFAIDKKTSEENSKMAADEIFTKNTGLTRMTDSMIDPNSSIRNETDYQAVINKIQSDPNWMNDPAARYNFAAATTLRNQKINAMKDTSPDQYDQYKDSINLNGEYMSTLPNVQWYKQFQSNENQRGFDNNLKTETFNENKRSNLVGEGLQGRQIGVSEGNLGVAQGNLAVNQGEFGLKKATSELAKKNDSFVSAGYSDYVASGKTFDEWLKTPSSKGIPKGSTFTNAEMNALIGMAKDAGKFSAKSNEFSLADLEKLDKMTPEQLKAYFAGGK